MKHEFLVIAVAAGVSACASTPLDDGAAAATGSASTSTSSSGGSGATSSTSSASASSSSGAAGGAIGLTCPPPGAGGAGTGGSAAGGAAPTGTLLDDLEYPSGLAVHDGYVYMTETRGRNTVYQDGAAIRLVRYDPRTGERVTLADHPTTPDAVAISNEGVIFLGGYASTIPGEAGIVSVLDPTSCTEDTIPLDIAIEDLAFDTNDDLYVIGSSYEHGAKSLYRLPASDRHAPVVVRRGLQVARSIAARDGTVYFGTEGEDVFSLSPSGGLDELPVQSTSGLTKTNDYLYYLLGDGIGRIRSAANQTGAWITFGLTGALNARADDAAGVIYVVIGGTDAAEYTDGSLVAVPIPD